MESNETEWDAVTDPETDELMDSGHSDIHGADVFYPFPHTQAQSDGMKALIEFAIREHWQDGQGWIKGYSMDLSRPCRSHTGARPHMWFPVTLEWHDGSGDKCRMQVEFFLEGERTCTSEFRVAAVVEHPSGYNLVEGLQHLHKTLCELFGTPLAKAAEDGDGGGDEPEWA